MRLTVRIFALLDIISICLLAQPFWQIITHFNEIPEETLSQIRVILTLPMFLLLFVSAIGLTMYRKFGFIAYYIQFPIRLVIWVFSIGFVTLLPELLNLKELWFDVFFKLCFIAEFFRLYFTIKIHREEF
ncbi:hypothetical protein QWY86_12245 [Pedobacter aquatilis]|uniref:hypothetical protein n=1 Tax=Pedobacter aquatilis TaxID=351343 RepID=UPI0025B4BAD5|nr:hypothetical protein [Pedobacter aquatilis]MDN3587446.1 hypothetical protein [Pedobacter aquatilis]